MNSIINQKTQLIALTNREAILWSPIFQKEYAGIPHDGMNTMNLFFDIPIADKYTSQSQRIRVLTEKWVNNQVFCPNCGQTKISQYENNKPVADFFCPICKEDFELKSKKEAIGTKIVDGAYHTMVERLQDKDNPNFFFLTYNWNTLQVLNFLVIPKHFFVPEIIEKRPALAQTAKRAGWVGCNILLQSIPDSGKIFFVKDRIIRENKAVLADWKKTLFLRNEQEVTTKGWLIDIMLCIEKMGRREFSLDDMYKFESVLSQKHPDNHNIKAKIRQQLQILRDKGYLDFIERGRYQVE